MAVRIRLQRHGKKGAPFYHIIATDKRAPRNGRFIERIGSYNPLLNLLQSTLMLIKLLHGYKMVLLHQKLHMQF